LTITLVENVSSGVLNLSQDGSFVYTPSLNFYGTESFSYKISTSTLESNVATVELIINPQLGAIEDVYELDSNTTLTVSAALGVLANDINPSNLPVNVVLVSDVDSGELTLNPDGSFVYIPELNSHGLDVFSYKLVSGIYESNTVLVFLAVEPKLLAYPDEYELDSNTSLSISAAQGVLANDFNPNNEAVTAVLVSGVASGELTLNPDGSFIYTPDENFHGVDQFTYRMSDGLNVSNIVSVSLEVGPGLLANPDEYELDSNTTLSVSAAEGVLTNDLNPSGLPVYAVLVSDVNSGELTLNPDGSFIYAPDNNFHGEDQFTYKMSAGGNVSNTVSVSLDVEPKLIANPDEYSGDSNQSLTVSASEGVLANDLNPTDDDLTITVVDEVSSGVLELSQDGSFVYTPNQNFYGTDTFTYKISTSNLESNVAIVEIKIIPQLEAVEDEYSLNMNSSLTVTVADGVLANDLNPSGLPVDAVLTFNAAFGTLTLNPNGSFTYVPMQNFSGTDYFSYQLKSGTYESNIARVEIHVLPLLNIYLPLVRR
jgi:Holliday junction resolvasome RuvABC endonuclease subunit